MSLYLFGLSQTTDNNSWLPKIESCIEKNEIANKWMRFYLWGVTNGQSLDVKVKNALIRKNSFPCRDTRADPTANDQRIYYGWRANISSTFPPQLKFFFSLSAKVARVIQLSICRKRNTIIEEIHWYVWSLSDSFDEISYISVRDRIYLPPHAGVIQMWTWLKDVGNARNGYSRVFRLSREHVYRRCMLLGFIEIRSLLSSAKRTKHLRSLNPSKNIQAI